MHNRSTMLSLHRTNTLALILIIQGAVGSLFDSVPLSLTACYGSPVTQATSYRFYTESVYGGAVVSTGLICVLAMFRDWQGRQMEKFTSYVLFVSAIALCVLAAADLQSKSKLADYVGSDEKLSESQLKAIQQSWISIEVGYVATILLLFVALFDKELPQKGLKRVVEGLLLGTMLSSLFFSVSLLCYIYEMMPLECSFLIPLPSSLWVWAVLVLILCDSSDDSEQEGNKENPTNSPLEEPLLLYVETADP